MAAEFVFRGAGFVPVRLAEKSACQKHEPDRDGEGQETKFLFDELASALPEGFGRHNHPHDPENVADDGKRHCQPHEKPSFPDRLKRQRAING